MAKIGGDFGSQQTTNGVVELLSPLTLVWRRAIEWGGTSALTSDGLSVTYDNTNLPLEGVVVMVGTDGKAVAPTAAQVTASTLLLGASLGVVWTGYNRNDSGAIDTITMIDGGYFLYDVSSDRVDATNPPEAGKLVYWDPDTSKYTDLEQSAGTNHHYLIGVCEKIETRGSTTFYRIKWNR